MGICPAYAGMILGRLTADPEIRYLSRVCGDDPCKGNITACRFRFVPRMRG